MGRRMFPADVISVCRADGGIRPLRFQVEGVSENVLKGDICRVLDTKQIHYTGAEANVFLCEARILERFWTVELKYMIRSHTWWLVDFLH